MVKACRLDETIPQVPVPEALSMDLEQSPHFWASDSLGTLKAIPGGEQGVTEQFICRLGSKQASFIQSTQIFTEIVRLQARQRQCSLLQNNSLGVGAGVSLLSAAWVTIIPILQTKVLRPRGEVPCPQLHNKVTKK